jgi:hypothetical protein
MKTARRFLALAVLAVCAVQGAHACVFRPGDLDCSHPWQYPICHQDDREARGCIDPFFGQGRKPWGCDPHPECCWVVD